jgi:hypothetical protein
MFRRWILLSISAFTTACATGGDTVKILYEPLVNTKHTSGQFGQPVSIGTTNNQMLRLLRVVDR